MQDLRCQSKNKQGIQCGFPKGHMGRHGNGMAIQTWEDQKPTYVQVPPIAVNGFNIHQGNVRHSVGTIQELPKSKLQHLYDDCGTNHCPACRQESNYDGRAKKS